MYDEPLIKRKHLIKLCTQRCLILFDYGLVTVSQFTLYGFLKGNKPDFHVAMAPQRAKPLYASLVDRFRNAYNSDAIKGMLSMFLLQFLFLLLWVSTYLNLFSDVSTCEIIWESL